MQLHQTRESLEHEDYKIFYDECKKEFYTTISDVFILRGISLGLCCRIKV